MTSGSQRKLFALLAALLLPALIGFVALGPALPAAAERGVAAAPAAQELPPANAGLDQEPGDRVALTGDLTVRSGEVVERDARAVSGHIVLEAGGEVRRDVIALAGDVEIAGKVGGNVTAISGNVTLEPGANVGGDVIALAGRVEQAANTTVGGKIRAAEVVTPAVPDEARARARGAGEIVVGLLVAVLFSLVFMAAGTVVVLAWPRRVQLAAATLSASPWVATAVGIMTALLLPPLLAIVSFVLAITIVGVLLVPVVWLASLVLWFYGAVTVGLLFGRRIAESGRIAAARESLLVTAVAGLAAFCAITFILAAIIPPLGWFTLYMLGFVGAGAGILSRFGSPQSWNQVPRVIATGAGRITRRLTGQPPHAPDQTRKAS